MPCRDEFEQLNQRVMQLEKDLADAQSEIEACKRAEVHAREARGRLDLALEGAEIGIWDWDLDSGTVEFDWRWARAFWADGAATQVVVRSWDEVVHPDDVEKVQSLVAVLKGQGAETFELEHRLVGSDGTWMWVISKGRVTARSGTGDVQRVTGTHLNITQRKLEELGRQVAEKSVRDQSLELRSLLQSISSAFVVWRSDCDDQGHLRNLYFSYVNEAYERVSGVTLDEVWGRSLREVWPETEQAWFDHYEEVIRTKTPKHFELFHAPTRRLYSCRAYVPPHLNNQICVVFEDISEQKAALATLEKLANEQRAILNAVSVGVAFIRDRHIQWVNPELTRMLGRTVEELVGQSTAMLYMDQADYESIGVSGYAEIAAGNILSTEVLFKTKDGAPCWVHLTGHVVDSANPDMGSIWTMNAINDRRHAELALRASEQRLKCLVHNSNDVIAITDLLGKLVYVTDTLTRVLGYDPADVVGTQGPEVHPQDRESLVASFRDVLRSPGGIRRGEYRYLHKNGHWIHMEVVFSNLLNEPAVAGIVFNMRDISERRQLTEQLQQAMKMEAVGRLAGGVAHDFNNLLTAISGNIELASMELEPGHALIPLLEDAAGAADSAAALTRQLLAFSRRQIIEPVVLNLNELVDSMRKMLSRIIGEDVRLTTQLAADLGSVRVDPGQFEQVLVNLAVNARDAMPGGGVLCIETSDVELDADYVRLHPAVTPGTYVMLSVSDTGEGMDAHVKQRLFEPFFTTKPKGRGTGLGLATIFGAVKQAGGTIEVYSEIGKGSSFKVYLPRVSEPATAISVSRSPVQQHFGHETVLLVEDDESVRSLANSILHRLGYRVLTAACGDEALALIAEFSGRLDLVMTDVVMPGMNGRELSDRVTQIHPEAEVLFTSGYTEDVIVHHGVVDADTNFIGKPYSVQALASKIREILEARK